MNVASTVAARWLPGQPLQNGAARSGSFCAAAPDLEQGLASSAEPAARLDGDGQDISGSSTAPGQQGAGRAEDAHALLGRARELALQQVAALQDVSRERGYDESLLLPDSPDGNEAFTDRCGQGCARMQASNKAQKPYTQSPVKAHQCLWQSRDGHSENPETHDNCHHSLKAAADTQVQ